MKISAPLLIDRLPLYSTDPELRAALFGAPAKDPVCCGWYERLTKLPNFPRMNATTGGRFVPLVVAWFEQYEDGIVQSARPTEAEMAERWERSGQKRGKAVRNKEE